MNNNPWLKKTEQHQKQSFDVVEGRNEFEQLLTKYFHLTNNWIFFDLSHETVSKSIFSAEKSNLPIAFQENTIVGMCVVDNVNENLCRSNPPINFQENTIVGMCRSNPPINFQENCEYMRLTAQH